jgi:hypothetical protein
MSVYGLWGLRSTRPLAAEQQGEIYEMFNSILGALDNMDHQREELERLESKLRECLADLPSNVIPLRRPIRAAEKASRQWIIKQDCLIEARYISEIHKMATELHAYSGRYAFLDYRDLDGKRRKSLPELLALGELTLFVPEFPLLSLGEQAVLRELIRIQAPNRPLLMAGTTTPFAELRSIPGVHLDFLASLSRAYIKLTRSTTSWTASRKIRHNRGERSRSDAGGPHREFAVFA